MTDDSTGVQAPRIPDRILVFGDTRQRIHAQHVASSGANRSTYESNSGAACKNCKK